MHRRLKCEVVFARALSPIQQKITPKQGIVKAIAAKGLEVQSLEVQEFAVSALGISAP
jgi:hypothetical protein